MTSRLFTGTFLSLAAAAFITDAAEKITWELDTLSQIGGNTTTVNGSPAVIATSLGKAVRFNGSPDQLVVANNPLDTATAFTIELILNPYDIGAETALKEPRVLHLQDSSDNDRRITMELRISNKRWYIDAFICSEKGKTTLTGKPTHDVDAWYNYSITYSKKSFVAYVNGIADDSGTVEYLPISKNGKVSLGCRLNKINYYKGAIKRVIFTKKPLSPDQFDASYKGTTFARADARGLTRASRRAAPLLLIENAKPDIPLFTISGKKQPRSIAYAGKAGGFYIYLPAKPAE